MTSSARATLPLLALPLLGGGSGAPPAGTPSPASGTLAPVPAPVPADTAGIPVLDETVVDACERCHAVDDDGMMTRVSYMRKTPEGWQQSIRRMVMLNEVELQPETARRIVRYLADNHGVAPEELRPGRFEVERRLIEWRYEADRDVAYTCSRCHSMGRVITQRRSAEEWELLMATHRGYYPLSDTQGFRRIGPPDPDATDARHPMEKAVAHLSKAFPLTTPEWTAWSATMRPPRLAGTWALRGRDPGNGPIYGTVEIAPGDDDASFTTRASYVNARTSRRFERSGRAVVYTGHQWRGRSFKDGAPDGALREVMTVERGWNRIDGRWFAGDYDEFGPDVTLLRVDGPVPLGVHPVSLRAGSQDARVRVYGADLPTGLVAEDVDFGPGVDVAGVVESRPHVLEVDVRVEPEAAPGARDVYVAGRAVPGSLTVYETVDRIAVSPRAGMARLGGGAFPKGYAQFEATAFSDGPDGEAETEDDLELGQVDVTWSLEEYAAVFDDDDIEYVGVLDENGRFEPAIDGPNPARTGSRNNVGDVWVVATYAGPDGEEVRGRAHLIVTVPLYMRWEPWRVEEGPPRPPRRTGG